MEPSQIGGSSHEGPLTTPVYDTQTEEVRGKMVGQCCHLLALYIRRRPCPEEVECQPHLLCISEKGLAPQRVKLSKCISRLMGGGARVPKFEIQRFNIRVLFVQTLRSLIWLDGKLRL